MYFSRLLKSVLLLLPVSAFAQQQWMDVSKDFGILPGAVKVYKSTTPVNGRPNIAYYVKANLKSKDLKFDTDTTWKRRLTPMQFFRKNQEPLVVVNTTFFSFATNQNLNAVIKDGRLASYNVHSIPGRGKDTLTYRHAFTSALGISKKNRADVAWLFTDSSVKRPWASQQAYMAVKDSSPQLQLNAIRKSHPSFQKWKMHTAVGGGPVLVQNGEVSITNNEELKFAGKAINDLHPRTAMGYTSDGHLVIMVVQGRFAGVAEGVSLKELAQMLKETGCAEALNLDGGGSSTMLVNGKETIKPSDKEGQRPVPAVFLIHRK